MKHFASLALHLKGLLLPILFFFGVTAAHAQWVPTQGPPNGYFFDALKHQNRIWGSTWGGLFYSENEGETWQRHLDFGYENSFSGMCHRGGNLFLLANINNVGSQFFKSADNGDAWEFVTNLPALPASYLSVHKGKLLIASNLGALYSSGDEGLTWQPVPLPVAGLPKLALPMDTSNLMVLFPEKGIFASADLGQTWQMVADSTDGFARLIDVRSGEIMASKEDFSAHYSPNLGLDWSLLEDPFPPTSRRTLYSFWGLDTIVAENLDLTPAHKISTDAGANWQDWAEWGAAGFLPSIHTSDGAINLRPEKYYSATQSVLLRNDGLNNLAVKDVKSNGQTIFAATFGDGIYATDDNGQDWEELPLKRLRGGSRGLLAVANDTLYVHDFDQILMAVNGGLSGWDTLAESIEIVSFSTKSLNASGDFLVGNTHLRPFLVNRTTGEIITLGNTPCMQCEFERIGSRFVISNRSKKVWTSDNGGQTWTQRTIQGSPFGGSRLFLSNGHLMLFTHEAVHFSNDNGTTWLPTATTGLPSPPPSMVNLFPNAVTVIGTEIYAAFSSHHGVYKSEDWGATWAAFNDGLGTFYINSMAAHGNQLFLGTAYSSVWTYDLGNVPVFSPSPISLQIMPNPTSGAVVVTLPTNTPARIQCYNSVGQMVMQKEEVVGSTTLDLANCAKGIYHILALSSRATWSSSLVVF
jgi:photosystem II stability/assembly factor-like uncharacterized protein